MRNADLVKLFDHSYWANHQVLQAASGLTEAEFAAPSDCTTRGLRATLVHSLDVEWSWRLRLLGEPPDAWGPEVELRPEDYPTADAVAEHWRRDEAEMRVWLGTLGDEELARPIDLSKSNRFPLWYYVVHILTHSAQQRADAATLLTRMGHSPGDLDFLDFADTDKARE